MFVVATTNLRFLQSLWMAWNLICWSILTNSELIKFGSSFVDFPHFGIILTGQICNFLRTSGERKGGMAWILACWSILIAFRTYIWSWSVEFHFLASFWLSETGQIWGLWQFSSECMGGMSCNLTCWCILTTFSTAYILVGVCWLSNILQLSGILFRTHRRNWQN